MITQTSFNCYDITGALRIVLGCKADDDSGPLFVAAAPPPNGEDMLELSMAAVQDGRPIILLVVDDPWNAAEPARIILFRPLGGSLLVHTDLTLWAANEREPAVLVFIAGSQLGAFSAGPAGLQEIARPPLGIENSAVSGIKRANDRLVRTTVALSSLRRVTAAAA